MAYRVLGLPAGEHFGLHLREVGLHRKVGTREIDSFLIVHASRAHGDTFIVLDVVGGGPGVGELSACIGEGNGSRAVESAGMGLLKRGERRDVALFERTTGRVASTFGSDIEPCEHNAGSASFPARTSHHLAQVVVFV